MSVKKKERLYPTLLQVSVCAMNRVAKSRWRPKARMQTTPLVVSPRVEKSGERAPATCLRAAKAFRM